LTDRTLLGLGSLGARLRRRKGLLLVSVGVTLACLWMLHRGALPVLPSRQALGRMAGWAVPAYALAFLLVQLLRAYRWRWILRPLVKLSDAEIVAANFVFFGALLVLPLRLGELIRPALLRRPGRVSAWQVMGLVGAERVVDGLLSSVMLLSALWLAGPPRDDLTGPATLVRPTALAMVSVFLVASLGVVAFFFFRRPMRALVERVLGVFSVRIARVVADRVESVAAGLEFLRIPRYGVPFLLASTVYWALNALSVVVLLRGAGVDDASFAHGGTLIGVLALGLLVPGAPGFFGTFQLSAYAGLAVQLGMAALPTVGAPIVFYMYVVQLAIILLVAGLLLPLSLRRLAQSGAEDAPSELAQEAEPPPA
jgi:hypothetical protein